MSDGKTNGSFGIKLPFEFNKDKLALLVGGMAVIALIFATYNFFNKSSDITSTQTERTNDTIELKDDFKTGTDKGEIKDKAATINPTSTSNSPIGPVWTANDYQEGDIKGSSYTVVRGDTLWEISEAVYGDGTQWHKILEANKTKVGFLPNGSQALIVPGQILALP